MARPLLLMVYIVLCTVTISSCNEVEDDEGKKVGLRRPREGEIPDGVWRQVIRSKGRTLFANYRTKTGKLMETRRLEWKESSVGLERQKQIMDGYLYIIKEAEYEIKQRIVDAVRGSKTLLEETVPAMSNEIADLFMDALYAESYEQQTQKEDRIIEIAKELLDKL